MKVKCINQDRFIGITPGKEYEVIQNLETFYEIKNDYDRIRNYGKVYFEVIPEPVIEEMDEVGVEEYPEPKFSIHRDGDNIAIEIDEVDTTLYFYSVASNCGVHSYHGVNYLYENCDYDMDLFRDIIKSFIEFVREENNCCMLVFSTNDEQSDIWQVLDEIMDFGSEAMNNPNSDMDVKLWIKYIE